jgi:hypothetical protein
VKKSDKDQLPKARREHLVVTDLDDETIIYDKRTHQATCLNSFAGQVWRLCNGSRTPADISTKMNVDNGEAEVFAALKKLSKGGLLSAGNDLPLGGRRGFLTGATAGLAAITTMTIPTASQAASVDCCTIGGSYNGAGVCVCDPGYVHDPIGNCCNLIDPER